jgi:hypothetical protein
MPLYDETGSSQVRLRDAINLVLGVGIIVAPWFNGDDVSTHGAIRLRLVAFAICAVALWIISHQYQVGAELVNAGLGIALISAPCWRGGIDAQRIDFAIAGAVVFAFSASCVVQLACKRRTPPPVPAPYVCGRYRFSKN